MKPLFEAKIYNDIDDLRRAVEMLDRKSDDGTVNTDRLEEEKHNGLDESIVLIERALLGITTNDLLILNERRFGASNRIGWNSTGRANPRGYCQHATPIWDRSHLRHGTGYEFTLYK